MKIRKGFVCILLSVCMCCVAMPAGVFAAEADERSQDEEFQDSEVQDEVSQGEDAQDEEITALEDDPGAGRLMGDISDDFYGSGIAMASININAVTHADRFSEGYTIEQGIDVSYYQGTIDWTSVKNCGVDFAIVRVAYRGYGDSGALKEDPQFKTNLTGAIAAGIPVGVYIYSQATTETEAVEEADFIIDKIQGYDVTLPVVMDFEYAESSDGYIGRLYKADLSAADATAICNAFCAEVTARGYTPMIYANKYMLENQMNASDLTGTVWLAHYAKSTNYAGDYGYWQYEYSNFVDGISGNVDMDFRYIKDSAEENPGNSSDDSSGNGSDDSSAKTYTTYKTTTSVNYRTGAGTSYSIKGTLASGTQIQVEDGYSTTANGYTWYRFNLNGTDYYIASNYVTKVSSSSSSSSSSSGSSSTTYTTYKTTTSVNYRTGAGTSYSVKGTLASGTQIQVEDGYSTTANGYTWYRFNLNGTDYYIASNYVTKVSSSSSSSSSSSGSSSTTYTTYKTTTSVNYRTGAGTSYSVKGTLASGTQIQVEDGYSATANGYTWYRFKLNGTNYYIASKYVTKVSSSSGSSSTTYTTYKTTTRVNYRNGAGTTYTVKGTLASGTQIQVEDGYSTTANGYTWYRFKLNGTNYYIASQYLKKA
ncbi:MAG: hypothetical protein LUC41_04335 [Clostridiales bacterium]|nr:hypothetical protein [Clostridiales bacterium]